MNNYPIILLPTEINSINNIKPKIPKEPLKPEIPYKKSPVKPNEISDDSGIGFGFLILIILLGVGFLLISIDLPIGYIMFISGILLFFYWITNWGKIQESKKKDYQQYLEDLKNYNFLLRNSESIYKADLKNYENVELIKYNTELKEFEKIKNILDSKEYIENYRKTELIKFFANSTKPIKLIERYSKGVSELFFLNYLKNNFTDVLVNHSIINDDFDGIPFNPDFVVYDSELNIFIDVEIDEPYIGKDGTPIHYLDGNDNFRNDFFLQNNWLVIRFAEIQIIKFPEKCCNIIKITLNSLKKNGKCNLQLIKLCIENYPCWDKNEANRLAYTRFRNKYLPTDLTENIDSEIMELEKKFLKLETEKEDFDGLPF